MPDVDRLLALANGAALHKALLREVPGAKYRTVARWVGVNRRQPPPEMVEPILRAFGLGETETAPPWWGEAAESLVDQIQERITSGGPAIPEDWAQVVVDRLVARLELPEPLDDEAPGVESAEPRGAAHRAAKRQR